MENGNLLITRKLGQSVTVGDAIITVIRLGKRGVRLSIAAPKSVAIVRVDAKLKTRGGETCP